MNYDSDLIEQVTEALLPEKVRVSLVGQKVSEKATMTEKWYGTKYFIEDITDDKISAWKMVEFNPKLHLPEQNYFIPKNFSLCTEDREVTEFPEKILTTPLTNLWYKQDREYKLPKNIFLCEMYSPIGYSSPHNVNILHMFASLIRDALNEYAYYAEIAGLSYVVNNTKYGLSIQLRGYYDKQALLLQKIIDVITNLKIDPQRFEMLKDSYHRGLKNFSKDQPHQHVVYYASLVLTQCGWSKEQLLERVEDSLTIESVEEFIPQFLSRLHLEMMVHGSVSRDWAVKLAEVMSEGITQRTVPTLPLTEGQKVKMREVQLRSGEAFMYTAKNYCHGNSAIEVILQSGLQNTYSNCMTELIAQILHEPAYDILRTKEQLGYIVFSGVRRMSGTQGIRVIIQSARHPDYLEERIEAFLYIIGEFLKLMPDKIFETHKQALIQRKSEKPKKLSSLSARWWGEISDNQLHFNRNAIEVECLKDISRQNVVDYFKKHFSYESTHRAKLVIQVIGTTADGHTSEKDDCTDIESGKPNSQQEEKPEQSGCDGSVEEMVDIVKDYQKLSIPDFIVEKTIKVRILASTKRK